MTTNCWTPARSLGDVQQFHLAEEHTCYYEPGAGFVMVTEAVRAQLDLAERHGAGIRRDERVLDIQPSAQGATVMTNRGRYGAQRVVLTAGPWLSQLMEPELAGLFTVYRQLLHWFDASGDPDSFIIGRFPVFVWEFGGEAEDLFYGFPAINGPTGGVKIATEQYREPADPDAVERTVTAAEQRTMYDHCVRNHIPGLGPRTVQSVACLYTVTPDYGFVIDYHPAHPDIIIVSPCSGHGFKHSAAIGEAVTMLATQRSSPLSLEGFSLRRFLSGADRSSKESTVG